MPNKTVSKAEHFDCPKCGRSVTFRYSAIQFSSDEAGVIKTSLDKITDYGQCQVAAEAAIPNRPVLNEMQECPVYQALSA